jgi:hypothetical protein
MPSVEHRQHGYLNKRAENSHQPPASGSGACKVLSRQDRPSGSPPMVVWRGISAHDGIACRRRPIGKGCGTDSTLGRTSRSSLLPPKVHDREKAGRFLPDDRVNAQYVDKALVSHALFSY